MNKKLIIICGIVVIGIFAFFSISTRITRSHYRNEIEKANKQISNLQGQVKVAEGMYSASVDKYDVTAREMKDSLKAKDAHLAAIIKQNKEKIQYYEHFILSLKNAKDTVFVTDTVPGQLSFALAYPKAPEIPFIKYKGLIKDNELIGSWEFGQLSLTTTLVEQKDGSWKSYVSGPTWITVGNIEVKALSKLDPGKVRKLYFPFGGGYQVYFDGKKSLYLSGGIQYKRWQVLAHSSVYEIGIGGLYSF